VYYACVARRLGQETQSSGPGDPARVGTSLAFMRSDCAAGLVIRKFA
jgi:hypothetical protein